MSIAFWVVAVLAVILYSTIGVRATARVEGEHKVLEFGIIPKLLVLLTASMLLIISIIAFTHSSRDLPAGFVLLALLVANLVLAYYVHFSKLLFNDSVIVLARRNGESTSIPWSNVSRRFKSPISVIGPFLVTKDFGRIWYSAGQHGYEEFDQKITSKLNDS